MKCGDIYCKSLQQINPLDFYRKGQQEWVLLSKLRFHLYCEELSKGVLERTEDQIEEEFTWAEAAKLNSIIEQTKQSQLLRKKSS